MEVWLNSHKDMFSKKWSTSSKLKVNDNVRVRRSKHVFEKGYSTTFSNEVFIIKEVIFSKPITYKLKAMNGTEILGIFYEFELSKVNDI